MSKKKKSLKKPEPKGERIPPGMTFYPICMHATTGDANLTDEQKLEYFAEFSKLTNVWSGRYMVVWAEQVKVMKRELEELSQKYLNLAKVK